ncbi:MAG: hypothetical protein AB7Q45_21745 [Planctomycetaceae bacterium]
MSRDPSPSELEPMLSLLEEQLERFGNAPQAAEELLKVGESGRNQSLSVSELAAYSIIANILLNLDETITKG